MKRQICMIALSLISINSRLVTREHYRARVETGSIVDIQYIICCIHVSIMIKNFGFGIYRNSRSFQNKTGSYLRTDERNRTEKFELKYFLNLYFSSLTVNHKLIFTLSYSKFLFWLPGETTRVNLNIITYPLLLRVTYNLRMFKGEHVIILRKLSTWSNNRSEDMYHGEGHPIENYVDFNISSYYQCLFTIDLFLNKLFSRYLFHFAWSLAHGRWNRGAAILYQHVIEIIYIIFIMRTYSRLV